ncbi:UNKNOWN [Stylonychia lemnae]|uniref:Uncharacterized protein n=1 Tax=Stylonychia lemnae TaxID=5949 RepID=A0A078B8D9_STYLE|nr:UNKNOWN [Stylonychia lemnae]|eukprot:CDW89557.1 UNKNOWN [Stylonychia lemnae]
MTSNIQKFRHFLKQFDQTGAPVSLNYNNSSTFKTTLGGTITLLSRLGIICYFLILAKQLYDQENKVTFKQVHRTANRDNQTNHINLENFDIAIGLQFYDGLTHLYEKQNLN